MAVIRVEKTKDFTVMSNYHLRDKRLSLKAKGLLSQMLSLPDDWDYTVNGLVAINKENRSAIDSALAELRSANYLSVEKKMPNETDSGRYEYIYTVYEQPFNGAEKQDIEKQGIEKQGVVFQYIENPQQQNTKEQNIDNKILNNKNTNNTIVHAISKKEFEEQCSNEFKKLWDMYPRKQGKTNAWKAYLKARLGGAVYSDIETGLKNYVDYIRKNKTEARYIKMGSTWFNQKCWEDNYDDNRGNKDSNGKDTRPFADQETDDWFFNRG